MATIILTEWEINWIDSEDEQWFPYSKEIFPGMYITSEPTTYYFGSKSSTIYFTTEDTTYYFT